MVNWKKLIKTEISVFPNPLISDFTVKFITNYENNSTKKVIIYDVLGKTIFENPNFQSEISIQNNFQDGLYIITIQDETGIIANKKIFIMKN